MYISRKACYNNGKKGADIMPMTDKRKAYLYNYHKDKLKRVPLDMPISDYERLKACAEALGLSVNGYIKQAIAERMERDNAEATESPESVESAQA